MHIGDQRCNLVPFAKGVGSVSVFKLPSPSPDKNHAAKLCFVWDAEEFRPGNNEVVMVLDVQVLDDTENLFFMAVWAWLSGSLVDDAGDFYVESENWPRDKLLALHRSRVDFGADGKAGNFFVRTRTDGKIAVRIFWKVNYELNGKRDYVYDSFPLDPDTIERIVAPPSGSGVYSLRYI